MPRKPRVGECVYCKRHGAITSDHVPPKCLFPPTDRVNLVTVNACPECHDTFKLDDEYFRVLLSVRIDLPEGMEADFLREQTTKTLRNEKSHGFRASLRSKSSQAPFYSPTGEYIGNVPTLQIEPARIRSTAERIVRGL